MVQQFNFNLFIIEKSNKITEKIVCEFTEL